MILCSKRGSIRDGWSGTIKSEFSLVVVKSTKTWKKVKPLKIVFRGLASVVDICWCLWHSSWGGENADQASVLSLPNYIYLIRHSKKADGLSSWHSDIWVLLLNLRLRISSRDVVPSGTKGGDPWFSPWAIRIVLGWHNYLSCIILSYRLF